MECVYRNECPKWGDKDICMKICPYYMYIHGISGKGGFWKMRNVPVKYEGFHKDNLPKDKQFDIIRNYISKLPNVVEKGTGLYIYSTPTEGNPLGTGTGKTTSAVAILNEFTKIQVKRHVQGQIVLKTNPSMFIKAADFQNIFNAQFRGHKDIQVESAEKYYNYKELMKEVQLLVIDDIAIRTGSEVFNSELYEVIDHRAVEELATIFTSNVPLTELGKFIEPRVASRIEGMTLPVRIVGKDYRKNRMGI